MSCHTTALPHNRIATQPHWPTRLLACSIAAAVPVVTFSASNFPAYFPDYNSPSKIVAGFQGQYYVNPALCGGAYVAIRNGNGGYLTSSNGGDAVGWRVHSGSSSCWQFVSPLRPCTYIPGDPSQLSQADMAPYFWVKSQYNDEYLHHAGYYLLTDPKQTAMGWDQQFLGDYCWNVKCK